MLLGLTLVALCVFQDLDGMFFDLEDDSDDMDKVIYNSSRHVDSRQEAMK
jgi:hypothetical protein